MYDELDNAAAAALWMLGIERPQQEHVGLLYEDGGIKRSPTQTQGRRDAARGAFAIPAGSLRALFHNHPAVSRDRDAARFSPDDVDMAKRLGVPSYISVGDAVRRYVPDRRDTGHKAGEEVLAEFPWDEFKSYIERRYTMGAPR